MAVDRRTVDLSAYPDLVVIYLGMRVNTWYGLKRLIGLGPGIAASHKAKPDGLLLHENLIFSLVPVHAGMRQYWRDWESLETWARSEPHRIWWQTFLKDSGGTGFWHETYFMRGGMEAIYDDMPKPIGMLTFAPAGRRGGRCSPRGRAPRAAATFRPLSSPSRICTGASRAGGQVGQAGRWGRRVV